ncbi:hypothetical protein L2729_16625 [Shewanella gelidimarina]|nr:hypothetical protein [Shewanella gelidimarina]MCL1059598.1 hypothetical protein [Shewanella gelidimarina]
MKRVLGIERYTLYFAQAPFDALGSARLQWLAANSSIALSAMSNGVEQN